MLITASPSSRSPARAIARGAANGYTRGSVPIEEVSVESRSGSHRFKLRASIPVRRARTAPRAGVLICPAMSVPALFYDRVLEAFAERDVAAVCTEWRGFGSSSLRASRAVDWGYRELLVDDLPAAADTARRVLGESIPWTLFGHSLGGQLGSIFAAREPDRFASLVTFASCSVDFRGWKGLESLGILAFTQAAALTARALGYYPGDRMGFGARDARTLVLDWSRQCRTGRYRAAGLDEDLELHLRRFDKRVLLVSCDQDAWAPPAAVERLRAKMPHAQSERWHYAREGRSLGAGVRRSKEHFAWAKSPAPWIDVVLEWILRSA